MNCNNLSNLDAKKPGGLEVAVNELKKSLKSPAFSYRDRELKGLINECLALLASIRWQKASRGFAKGIDITQQFSNKKARTKYILRELMIRKIVDRNKFTWDNTILLVTCNKNILKLKKEEKRIVRELLMKGFEDDDNWEKYQYFYYSIFSKVFNVKEDTVMNYFRNISSIVHTLVY